MTKVDIMWKTVDQEGMQKVSSVGITGSFGTPQDLHNFSTGCKFFYTEMKPYNPQIPSLNYKYCLGKLNKIYIHQPTKPQNEI